MSEYDDNGAYGHVALGRSFALEIGATIPTTDHKLGSVVDTEPERYGILIGLLGAIDRHGDCNINTASDFIAQYSTRQEYRYADALPENKESHVGYLRTSNTPSKTWSTFPKPISDQDGESSALHISKSESDLESLARLAHKAEQKGYVSEAELRDILRRAAALLCKADVDQCGIVRYLVEIPFTIFTKQSIKLGISLWLGVINENPVMEPRILSEIAQNWETTVHANAGVFSEKLRQARFSV